MVDPRRPPRAQDTPDEALMARYADGDTLAFEELFHRYEPRAYAFFLRRTASRERAEDLYQELFLRIHRARERYDAARPFAPWLFQIAHRLLVDDVRRAHRSHEVAVERDAPAERGGSDVSLGDRELLARALAALSPDEREVLVASKLEGIAYREIAARVGKSAAAVRQLASRAMRRLRAAPTLTG